MEEIDHRTDTFWTKEKIKEVITRQYASDSQPWGDGDQPQRSCRLCAGERGLRGFCDPRGERYDSLVMHCFGVVVTPSDSLICERCVRQLRSTERFKTLVEAAFEKTPNDSATPLSSTTCVARIEPKTLTIKPPVQLKSVSREIIQKKHKKVFREKKPCPAPVAKKNNVACSICKQRYPVLAAPGAAEFVCARCGSRAARAPRAPPRPGARGDAGRERAADGIGLKTSQKKCDNILNYHREPRRYDCSQCKQRFILPQRLAEHISNVHRDSLDTTCIVCGNDLKTPAKLEKHLKIHTGELHQCELCMDIFKSKYALQTHLIGHKKAQLAA